MTYPTLELRYLTVLASRDDVIACAKFPPLFFRTGRGGEILGKGQIPYLGQVPVEPFSSRGKVQSDQGTRRVAVRISTSCRLSVQYFPTAATELAIPADMKQFNNASDEW